MHWFGNIHVLPLIQFPFLELARSYPAKCVSQMSQQQNFKLKCNINDSVMSETLTQKHENHWNYLDFSNFINTQYYNMNIEAKKSAIFE